MAANHSNDIVLGVSAGQVLALLRDRTFCSKLNLELKSENRSETGTWFRFHHGVTFSSWGEKVTITLTPLSPTETKIDVHSECGMPTQIIDWGKNKQNVCNILEYIEANIQTYAAFAQMSPAQTAFVQEAPAKDTPVQEAPVQNTPVQEAPAQTAPSAEAPRVKYCGNCGKQIPGTAAFCNHCGAKQPQ